MSKCPALASTLLAATLVLATSLPSLAAGDVCDFQAYSDDADPAGTNVRSGPGTDHDVIGVLKASLEDGFIDFSPEFQVIGFDKGWFQIGDATSGHYGDAPEQVVFKGPGWVSAKLVHFEIQDGLLREGPSLDAATVLDMGTIHDDSHQWNLDEVSIQTIHGCDGGFLDVTVANATDQTKRGWVTGLCGNQATTCS